jgi:2,3-dihydroxybenzoate-AMP ligase
MTSVQPKAASWPEEFAERYRREGYWQGITLGSLLRNSAQQYPDHIAVIDGERQWTYAQLNTAADELAAGLFQLGVRSGDKVVVQLPNIGELPQVIFALFRLGAVPVFALPAHRAFELESFCRQTQAKTYITADRFGGFDYRALARQLKNSTELQHIIVVGEAAEFIPLAQLPSAAIELPDTDPSAIALLQLSGGTTSIPKLIPRTHDDYFYSVRASAEICQLSDNSVYLAVLPAVHNFPLSSPGMLGVWHAGGTVVMALNGAPETAFALIAKHRVTITALVPPLALAWLSAVRQNQMDLSSLQVVQVGGAKLSAEVAKQILQAFPGRLQQVFGMAEGLVNYTRLDDPDDLVIHTQGRPISAADEIRIVDEDDRELPRNQLGQLLTRGPYTIRGYFPCGDDNLDRLNAKNFTPDGFYRTGDMVRLTDDGYLIVEGRCKDQINRGGEKISAEEVENHLLAHPAVHDVAMVGMADPYLGERNCVFIIPATDSAESIRLPKLRAFLRERGLADYKLPDRVEILAAFPKTSFGKVSKKALREMIADLTPQI